MTPEEKDRWLDRCRECSNDRPLSHRVGCDLAQGIRKNSKVAMDNASKFTNEIGVCKMFSPKEVR